MLRWQLLQDPVGQGVSELRIYKKIIFVPFFKNILNPTSVNFGSTVGRCAMVVLWNMDTIKNGLGPLFSKLFAKNIKNARKHFLPIFSNNLSGRARIYIFTTSVCNNMTTAHPPTVELTLYDQN